jgi:hypothetical protein
MGPCRRICSLAAALAVLSPAAALAAPTPAPSAATLPGARLLLESRLLWATINVCNAPDQLNTVGVRGSMPGDGQPHDVMYMRFRLQYLNVNGTTKQWVDLAGGAAPAFAAVGSAKSSRQAGSSFQLVPVAGKPAVELRGVVSFQWRRGATVMLSVSRPTTAGHQSFVGADPAGFSAASCSIG